MIYRNHHPLRSLWARYKKPLITALVALFVIASIGLIGLGFAAYKTASFIIDEVKGVRVESGTHDPSIPVPNPSVMEGLVLGAAGFWLEQEIAENNTLALRNGLVCFDALGGPSPSQIVAYVRQQTNETWFTERLDGLAQNLAAPGAVTPDNGGAACASLLLGG